MFFGLTNSPATFQAMMDHIFRPLIDKHAPMGTVIRVYMDDIIIGTSSTEINHTLAVHDVLNLLEEHDLFLKPEKCTFHAPRVDYLGVVMDAYYFSLIYAYFTLFFTSTFRHLGDNERSSFVSKFLSLNMIRWLVT